MKETISTTDRKRDITFKTDKQEKSLVLAEKQINSNKTLDQRIAAAKKAMNNLTATYTEYKSILSKKKIRLTSFNMALPLKVITLSVMTSLTIFFVTLFTPAITFAMTASNQAANIDESGGFNWLLIGGMTAVGIALAMFFLQRGDFLKISVKMFSLVSILVAVLAIVASVAIKSMNEIGMVAEEDIPLLEAISEITANQLEQSVWLERAALASGLDAGNRKRFSHAKDEFHRLARMVENEIRAAESKANQAISRVDDRTAKAEYQNVLRQLESIESEHDAFDKHGDEMFELLDSHDMENALEKLLTIEEENDTLNHELEALQKGLGQFTEQSARNAQQHGQEAVQTVGIISFVGVILALFVAAIIVRSILASLAIAIEQTQTIAEGDLTKNINIKSTDEIGQMLTSLMEMQTKTADIVTTIKKGSGEVAIASEQVSTGNTNLSQRTQEQAASLEEIASSMEEMSSTVNQNSESTGKADKLARESRLQAEELGNVVSNAITAMNDISTASGEIAQITGVIDEIAFQTNLLALNAAVEAARAGDQGRGFAVVAGEVRNLAGRCKTAAKEISDLIKDSVTKIEGGTKLVGDTGTALEEIVLSVAQVSDIVAEVQAASKQQSAGIEQVTTALTQLDDMTQQNAALVEESAAASELAMAQAQELNDSVSFFRTNDDLASIGAATHFKRSEAALNAGAQTAGMNRLTPANQTVGSRPATGRRSPLPQVHTSALKAGTLKPTAKQKDRSRAVDDEWDEF